jgi:hypothetical protein
MRSCNLKSSLTLWGYGTRVRRGRNTHHVWDRSDLYTACSVCNKFIRALWTDAWMSYDKWSNSCALLLFIYKYLSCSHSYKLLYSNLSGTLNTEYLFNPSALARLSNRFTANALGRFSNLFKYLSLHFLITLFTVFILRSSRSKMRIKF